MDDLVLAIDPGRKKCGIALVDSRLIYLEGKVIDNEELVDGIKGYLIKYQVKKMVIGGGTNSENIRAIIKENFLEIPITVIAEEDTTMEARRYFFNYNPPTGWLRFLPGSLRIPPRPYDDFAAYVIARRFFTDKGAGRKNDCQ